MPTPLPDIDEVTALTEEDESCIEELKGVLKRHGKLTRFGLSLLHEHFPIDDDEILLEECDAATRTLTIRPVTKSALVGASVKETNWRLDTMDSLSACQQVCITVSDGKGGSTHAGHHNSG